MLSVVGCWLRVEGVPRAALADRRLEQLCYRSKSNYVAALCSASEDGSYLKIIDSCLKIIDSYLKIIDFTQL